MDITKLSSIELRIIWAFFWAEVEDRHAPSDELLKEDWEIAKKLLEDLDLEINKRFNNDKENRDK